MASDATKQKINQSLIDLKNDVAKRTQSVVSGVTIPELDSTLLISPTDQLILETNDGTKRTTLKTFGDYVGQGLVYPQELVDARNGHAQLKDRLDAMDNKIVTNEQNIQNNAQGIQNNSQEIAELKAKHEADMQEVINAREDAQTPGTVHDNLKQRLDSDYNYLNSEIEKTNTQLSILELRQVKMPKLEMDIAIDGSNVFFSNLKKHRDSTSFGAPFFFINGERNIVSNCEITSGSNGIIFGNEGYQTTPKFMKALFNKITANGGNRARNGKDGVVNGEHDWFMNDISTLTREVGIESWTGKSRIAFNRIINPDGNGGHGGITLGHEGHQKALFNYVNGFGYGIEVGNSKRDILIDGNTVENCSTGICVSSDGHEKTINITNNYISLKENGIGISLSGAECVTISNCIIEYISDNDYTNPSSRSGIGIEVITNMKQVNIENCIFINVSIPFKGSCENYHVSNCKVFNCHEIFKANSYNAIFSKCYFENFNVFRHYAVQGKFLKVENSTFKIASDHSNSGGYVFNGRGNNTTSLLISENNTFENCLENPMVKNAAAGGVDIRPLIFKTNGVYYTFNKQSFSDIKSLAPACGIELMGGDYFIDNYYSLEFRAFKNGNHHMINSPSIPTTGSFIKGDRVYNNMKTDVTCDGWVCTVGGDFSGNAPTFKKFGLLES